MKSIQSLERAFDILEFLSDTPETSVALGDIARAAGLHPATCSHLVGTMVDRGYVQTSGPRQGYQLGPMPHYLIRNKPCGSDLVPQAQPLLTEAARALGEWVVLTVMAGNRRLVLLEVNRSSRMVQLDLHALRLAEQAYDSASIWVFLANMPEAQRQRFVSVHGMPDKFPTSAAMDRQLGKVRAAGHAVYEDTEHEVAKIAYPVQQGPTVVAAVGVHLPAFRFVGEHRERIMGTLSLLASQLSV
jgi:IclR family acetate operon transcriptional repressor